MVRVARLCKRMDGCHTVGHLGPHLFWRTFLCCQHSSNDGFYLNRPSHSIKLFFPQGFFLISNTWISPFCFGSEKGDSTLILLSAIPKTVFVPRWLVWLCLSLSSFLWRIHPVLTRGRQVMSYVMSGKCCAGCCFVCASLISFFYFCWNGNATVNVSLFLRKHTQTHTLTAFKLFVK